MATHPQAHAYIDESRRGRRYAIACTLCPTSQVANARGALRHALPKRRSSFHAVNESDRDRKIMLDTISHLDLPTTLYTIDDSNDQTARSSTLIAAIETLTQRRVVELILESRGRVSDRLDRQLIAKTTPTYNYDHRQPTEPLLWVPDLIAWCFGRDQRWRDELTRRSIAPEVIRLQKR